MADSRLGVAVALAAALLVQDASADEIENWFAVSEEKAAIALIAKAPKDNIILYVADGDGEKLDSVEWNYLGLPLLQQYRVPIGEYRLDFEGNLGSLLVQAKANEVVVVELTPDNFGGFDVTLKSANFEPRKSFIADFVGTISAKVGYGEIEPRYFAPAKNTLHFRVTGPGVKPPPG